MDAQQWKQHSEQLEQTMAQEKMEWAKQEEKIEQQVKEITVSTSRDSHSPTTQWASSHHADDAIQLPSI